MNYPLLIFVTAFVCLWASARLGAFLGRRKRTEFDDGQFGVILSSTLTLLGLLVGFSFSMAITRYEQRKDYEEEEANAIGTEYVRADLLRDPVRSKVQGQLVQYLDMRIRKYEAHASDDTTQLGSKTAQLQSDMWSEVKDAAAAEPNPLMATVVTGMNNVINRQGYTQAARWNRIPLPAWALMASIALLSNFLIGYGAKKPNRVIFLIVPLAIAVSFFLVADIDSPQGGLIRVAPHNLMALADSLRSN